MDFTALRDSAAEWFNDPSAVLGLIMPVLGNILAALAIFVVGRWLAKVAVRLLRKALARGKFDDMLIGFLANVAYGLILAIVIISALGKLGVDTTSAAAVLGGAALAIGLALQDQLSSFAAGVMLMIFRPFGKGNFVEINGQLGTVDEIKITSTLLKTPNNQLVWIPNAKVWGNMITNFSALPIRRVDLTIGVSYGSDLKKAKEIMDRLIEQDERFLTEPAPAVMVSELADSSVNFICRPWAKSPDWWAARCALLENIKLQFDAAGIEIPFPQRTVWMRQDTAEEEAAALAE